VYGTWKNFAGFIIVDDKRNPFFETVSRPIGLQSKRPVRA
jgi:hypothetical protein